MTVRFQASVTKLGRSGPCQRQPKFPGATGLGGSAGCRSCRLGIRSRRTRLRRELAGFVAGIVQDGKIRRRQYSRVCSRHVPRRGRTIGIEPSNSGNTDAVSHSAETRHAGAPQEVHEDRLGLIVGGVPHRHGDGGMRACLARKETCSAGSDPPLQSRSASKSNRLRHLPYPPRIAIPVRRRIPPREWHPRRTPAGVDDRNAPRWGDGRAHARHAAGRGYRGHQRRRRSACRRAGCRIHVAGDARFVEACD